MGEEGRINGAEGDFEQGAFHSLSSPLAVLCRGSGASSCRRVASPSLLHLHPQTDISPF